jgi:hypothetical protein
MKWTIDKYKLENPAGSIKNRKSRVRGNNVKQTVLRQAKTTHIEIDSEDGLTTTAFD